MDDNSEPGNKDISININHNIEEKSDINEIEINKNQELLKEEKENKIININEVDEPKENDQIKINVIEEKNIEKEIEDKQEVRIINKESEIEENNKNIIKIENNNIKNDINTTL